MVITQIRLGLKGIMTRGLGLRAGRVDMKPGLKGLEAGSGV